jgi:hypothetical protein
MSTPRTLFDPAELPAARTMTAAGEEMGWRSESEPAAHSLVTWAVSA